MNLLFSHHSVDTGLGMCKKASTTSSTMPMNELKVPLSVFAEGKPQRIQYKL